MIIALSPAITIPGAILAGGVGGIMALLGPVIAARLRRDHDSHAPVAASWLALFLCELVAAVLLFSAGKAFGVLPTLATALKIGVIVLAALGLSMVGAIVLMVRRVSP